jgi:hypothetical protein
METHNADIGHAQAGAFDQLADGRRLGSGQRLLRLCEDRRIVTLEIPFPRLGQCFLEQSADRWGIWRQGIGTEALDTLAIGLEHGHIDIAVEHGAGHEAHSPDRVHSSAPNLG